MKFTVFTVLLTISTTWGLKSKTEEPKDKREASGTYLPQSSHNYQSPSSLGQEEANAISIGAGYSVGGGAKPTYSFGGQNAGVGASYQLQPESGHANLQLAGLQSSNGGLVSNDLSQLMSQISQGLNSGAISLPSSGGQGALYQFAGQGSHGGQEISLPQFTYGSPQLQQYSLGEQSQGGAPAYAFGTKGLGTYGSTGPVLFSPESSGNQAALSYAAPNFGQSYQAAALPLGDSGHSLPGFSFGGSGQSFGGSLKGFSGNYATPAGKSSFKPSAFLGSSVQSDSGAGLAGLTGSYGSPSFTNFQSSAGGHGISSLGAGGHGAGFGSLSAFSGGPSKGVAASYLPSKFEGVGSLESIASAFSASGQIGQPGATYGSSPNAYSSNAHAASAPSPAYYISSGKHSSPSFGLGSSSYRSPASGHSSLNSFSSGPKYSFGGQGSSRYLPAKDIQGSYSEPKYNTIKYSEEFKPRFN
ncbi:jg12545 [Pararge aegeria aegeria]|uniref:Jg12545 protein n=1 Tax=Pararge aegeria aegeria TaxID=348720 RepID=A0A8S4S7K0_9NEOP|nr:jg12545 [Pararge aegeria aegeria]